MDADAGEIKVSRRKTTQPVTFCIKKERNALFKKVSTILQKPENERNDEEKEVLRTCSDLVTEVKQRLQKRQKVKARQQEIEDPPDVLDEKCSALADAISGSQYLVVYTGAGISTAACIPDYRGTNGIWTLLQQGKDIGMHDLSLAEPTLTHMALAQLFKNGILKHIVSQNCDGLHLRSGLPKHALSEVHGNMYIEVCKNCKPPREYIRLFDVTENTARYNHRTTRRCYLCRAALVDTIVHFGERGTLRWPLNWVGACDAADKADVILCVGSSLKVLKKYPWLWCMDKPVKKRPKLYIVNLQWTPKDDQAVLKIHGKCDEVMARVMSLLNIKVTSYNRENDPLIYHATILHPDEEHTTSQPLLRLSASEDISKEDEKDNTIKSEVKKEKDEGVSNNKDSEEVCANQSCEQNENLSANSVNVINQDLVKEEIMDSNTQNTVTHHDKIETCVSEFSGSNKHKSVDISDMEVMSIECATVPTQAVKDIAAEDDSNGHKDVIQGSESLTNDKHILNTELKVVSSHEEVVSESVLLQSVFDKKGNFSVNSILGNKFGNSSSFSKSGLECTNPRKSSNLNQNVTRTSCWPDPIMTILNLSEEDCSNLLNKSCQNNISVSNKRSCRLSSKRSKICECCTSFDNLSTAKRTSSKPNKSSSDKVNENICDIKKDIKYATKCSYCTEFLTSQECQFYSPHVLGFKGINAILDPEICICECCDDADDEDEEDNEEDEIVDVSSDINSETDTSLEKQCSSGMDSSTEIGIKSTNKVPIVNPGWYGKGYRKRIKRK